jgi:predicted DNA repair protein MutK
MVPLYFLITYVLEIGGVYDQYEGGEKISVCRISVGEPNLYM